jgi:hypothetical protein
MKREPLHDCAWRRRALDYRAQMRELQSLMAEVKRERDSWRRLAQAELKARAELAAK